MTAQLPAALDGSGVSETSTRIAPLVPVPSCVKENGVRAIEKLRPYELTGDASVMKLLDELLTAFVAQKRMKLPGSAYKPCYRLVG